MTIKYFEYNKFFKESLICKKIKRYLQRLKYLLGIYFKWHCLTISGYKVVFTVIVYEKLEIDYVFKKLK